MKLVQQTEALEPQFREIVENGIDKRVFADVTNTGGADVEYSIEHGAGTIPLGFIVINQDKAAVTYKSDETTWDESYIYLKTSVSNVALRVLIF